MSENLALIGRVHCLASIRFRPLSLSAEARNFDLSSPSGALEGHKVKACVRVPTANNGVRNPGLLQSHNGSGTSAGMIRDGSACTSSGDGIKQNFAKTSTVIGSSGSRALDAAARLYNSDSADY
ncbi:unnamed protein product [Clonostachys chloroleuca]|uniref:Uncharacterized protein n=1 Tax=Clonostachys chloroleuca TaxID=1926264 RepID=A0AA35PYD8_9HYPO|nr:unnamed protein product [Clonostachys chloroleuca]